MRRTIAEFQPGGRKSVTRLLRFGHFRLRRHAQVDPAALTGSPLVQPRDDFFHGLPDRRKVPPPVAAYRILALLDDVAAPAGARQIPGGIGRLHRHDFVIFVGQGDDALQDPMVIVIG